MESRSWGTSNVYLKAFYFGIFLKNEFFMYVKAMCIFRETKYNIQE